MSLSFAMEHVFRNVSGVTKTRSSPQMFHDVLWYIWLEFSNDHCSLFLECHPTHSMCLETITMDGTIAAKSPTTGKFYRGRFQHTFEENSTRVGLEQIDRRYLMEQMVVDDRMAVRCEVRITARTAVLTRRTLDFDTHVDGLTDVVLLVKQSKFFGNKELLAIASPVLRDLFFGDGGNAELLQRRRFRLEGVEERVFQQLLCIIFKRTARITVQNVIKLLETAHRFKVDLAKKKCEQFIHRRSKFGVERKLRLAEKYGFARVRESCMKSFKTAKRLKEAIKKFRSIGPLTTKALLERAVKFL